jgi:hypothetical protein
MPICANCGETLVRSHRKLWERLVYALVFKCKKCEARSGAKFHFYFYLSRHCKCPRCGTEDVEKRTGRDKIDKVIRTPVSMLQGLIGAQLYHCVYCRLQFYDLRGRNHKRLRAKTVSPTN